ncbi:hypothetical protein D3C71_1743740 [compost metagenome]
MTAIRGLSCAHCGRPIATLNDGWVEWTRNITAGPSTYGGFRIVHHDVGCMYNSRHLFQQNKTDVNMHLDYFVGQAGLNRFTDRLTDGVIDDMESYVEVMKQLITLSYQIR